MNPRFILLLVGGCIIITLSACSNAMQLAYKKPQSATAFKGELCVILEDQRTPDRGGNNPLVVGNARNTFGMPFAIKASPEREPSKVAKEVISDCLTAAGYKVVNNSIQAPQLHAVLKIFWSDGYHHSRMGMRIPMELKKTERSRPAWEYDLDINTGFTWKSAGFSQFNAGFNKMLETAKEKLMEQFKSADFEKRYRMLR